MREAMLTVPKLFLRAYIVCPVTLHNYSLPKTTRQVKGVNSILFHNSPPSVKERHNSPPSVKERYNSPPISEGETY
jgi:hypothetical protein